MAVSGVGAFKQKGVTPDWMKRETPQFVSLILAGREASNKNYYFQFQNFKKDTPLLTIAATILEPNGTGANRNAGARFMGAPLEKWATITKGKAGEVKKYLEAVRRESADAPPDKKAAAARYAKALTAYLKSEKFTEFTTILHKPNTIRDQEDYLHQDFRHILVAKRGDGTADVVTLEKHSPPPPW